MTCGAEGAARGARCDKCGGIQEQLRRILQRLLGHPDRQAKTTLTLHSRSALRRRLRRLPPLNATRKHRMMQAS